MPRNEYNIRFRNNLINRVKDYSSEDFLYLCVNNIYVNMCEGEIHCVLKGPCVWRLVYLKCLNLNWSEYSPKLLFWTDFLRNFKEARWFVWLIKHLSMYYIFWNLSARCLGVASWYWSADSYFYLPYMI